jgi:FkbM family methyltransferase
MKIVARRCVELLSRGRSFRRSIRVNGQKVRLYVSPDAQLRFMKPGSNSFDRDLIRVAERCLTKDSCVWDVGANVGVFTFAAAAIVDPGTVVSVEADNWLVQLLRRSRLIESNRSKDIRILPAAASDVDGLAEFHIAARGRASNTLAVAGGNSQMGGVRERCHVPTLRLDTVAQHMPRPDFVKIDVEGAELLVLDGANELASEIRPMFYIEVGEKKFSRVKAFFDALEYEAFDPDGRVIDGASYQNYFFVPKEDDAALEKVRGLSD